MTDGPHPSARVAGGPARQRRARGERPSGPRGEEREGEGVGPDLAQVRGREILGFFFLENHFNFVYFLIIFICALKIPLKFDYTF